MTSIRMPRDDEEALLPEYEEARSPRQAAGTAPRTQFWPKDIEGMNQDAKEGSVNSSHVHIRMAFLRKVFGILSFQIVLTTAICAAIYMTPGIKEFVQANGWVLLLTLVGSIGLIIAMHVHARNVPTNYVLLASFTVVQALTLGTLVSMFEVGVILEAALLTSVIVFSLFAYTLQSKKDFVKHYAIAYSMLGILLVAGVFQIFIHSSAFNFFVNVFGAALFCLFLMIDLDMIMNYMNAEDYILACITLYMDVINLFIRILQIVAEAQRN
ncbi:unnamed protein product, partial [Mesorhabditis belari]|uniref:Transmembrane BAX inhibitor motif-containing protein 4 n=1 Tax=Mesorhabditis belari TaxID=2138241 RepID=A0AAF3J7R9_9BILA